MLKNKDNTKQANNKQRVAKKAVAKQTWLRWSLITLAKLSFTGACALGLFIIYLDAKVQQTFEGQRWQVPVQVYGQVQTLTVGEQIDLDVIAQSLRLNGYKKVSKLKAVKQYAQSVRRLVIFQDDFDFPTEMGSTDILSGNKLMIEQ